MMMFPKSSTLVSKAIRELPKHHDIACTMRTDGCTGGPVCLCHIRGVWALGGNKKPDDSFGYYGCDACHKAEHRYEAEPRELLRALYESQRLMREHGVLVAPQKGNPK